METKFICTCNKPIIVVLDLEATGLDEEDQIIQIAACTRKTMFDVYITPTRPVNPKASEITGLEMRYGYLYLNGLIVFSKSPVEAFKDFLDYLRNLKRKVIFVAHNGFKFDMPKIIKLAKQVGYLEEFEALVSGFSDSLIMFRNVLHERLVQRKRFSMQALVEDYIGDASGLHNANNDVLMLLKLLDLTGVSDEYIVQQSRTIEQYLYFETVNNLRDYNGILPTWMICRLANNRIDSEVLTKTYNKLGYDGINNLFKETIHGKPRVTDDEHFINLVCHKLFNDSSKICDKINNDSTAPKLIEKDYDFTALITKIKNRTLVKRPASVVAGLSPNTTTMIVAEPRHFLKKPYATALKDYLKTL